MRHANASNLWIALAVAVTSIVAGTILFQASALAYDYMKLQKLPLYSSAASLPEFSDNLSSLVHEMDGPTAVIRGVIRERGTIDLVVADKASAAKNAITDARTYLKGNLNDVEQGKYGFKETGLSFTETDAVFQKFCPSAENVVADNEIAPLDIAAPAAAPASKTATSKDVTLAAGQAAITKACHIDVGSYCAGGVPKVKRADAKRN